MKGSSSQAVPTRIRPGLVIFAVLGLTVAALRLRMLVDLPGVLDIDTLNFGLSAFRFSLTEHQPHPPGYLGYVGFLKVIHWLAPQLSPPDVAKWGSRLSGCFSVPAAWWAVWEILKLHPGPDYVLSRGETIPRPFLLPLLAAGVAMAQPMLWYYGGDGQSHGAEGTLTLILVAATVRVVRREGLGPRLLLVAFFGGVGMVRPTIPFLASPLLVWVFWGRPLREWAAALVVGVSSVLVWYIPLVQLSGGLDVYRRATDALVGQVFMANASIFGSRHEWIWTWRNLQVLAIALVFAGPTFLAWIRARGETWRWIILAVVGLNIVFYSATFMGEEPGYATQIAALSCLVPAMWPSTFTRGQGVRVVAVVLLSPLLIFGPPWVLPFGFKAHIPLPTFQRVLMYDLAQTRWLEEVCPWAKEGGALVITDNATISHSRLAPLICEGLITALQLQHPMFNPVLDGWTVFLPDGQMGIPTGIPLEPGPAITYTLPHSVGVVVVPTDCSRTFVQDVFKEAACPPIHGIKTSPGGVGWPDAPLVWPASCLTDLKLMGASTLHLPVSPGYEYQGPITRPLVNPADSPAISAP